MNTSTGKQLTLMACRTRGSHGVVLRSTHGDMRDVTSMAIMLGMLLLLIVWRKQYQEREQAGTRDGSREGWWIKGLVDDYGKRERVQSIVHPQLFALKDGDNLRAPLPVHPIQDGSHV